MAKSKLNDQQEKYVASLDLLTNRELLNELVEATQEAEYFEPMRWQRDQVFRAVLERMDNGIST